MALLTALAASTFMVRAYGVASTVGVLGTAGFGLKKLVIESKKPDSCASARSGAPAIAAARRSAHRGAHPGNAVTGAKSTPNA